MKKSRRRYPCIESTVDVKHGELEVRLWIDQTATQSLSPSLPEHLVGLRNFLKEHPRCSTVELFGFIESLKDVNAAQISTVADSNKSGVVVYYVDFASDVHG